MRSEFQIDTEPVEELWRALNDGVLCPVIGAGVSKSVGVPSWDALLQRVINRSSSGPALAGVQRIEVPLAVDLLSEGTEWVTEQLRSELYPEVVADGWTAPVGPEARLAFINSAPSLIAKLCVCIASRAAATRTFHALTYNFDVLVEEAIAALGHDARAMAYVAATGRASRGEEVVAPAYGLHSEVEAASHSCEFVFRPDESRREHFFRRAAIASWRRQEIILVHPHGVLLRSGAIDYCADAGIAGLTFDANSYDAASWSTFSPVGYWQLAAFTSLRCLFLGFSFRDPQVRRLMRFAEEIRSAKSAVRQRHIALIVEGNRSIANRMTVMMNRLGLAAWVFTEPWPVYHIIKRVVDRASNTN